MSSRSKRTSSEYYFQPQTKKVLNDESEEYKTSIYQKTMQKLKDGAKNASPKSVVDIITTPTKSSTLHSEIKKGLKQISLNSKCGLENDKKISNPKEFCSTALPLPQTCSFCERLGCFATLNQCSKCTEHFCDKCSFSTFTALEGSHVCKSCYR